MQIKKDCIKLLLQQLIVQKFAVKNTAKEKCEFLVKKYSRLFSFLSFTIFLGTLIFIYFNLL
jgi:hypothetical protein